MKTKLQYGLNLPNVDIEKYISTASPSSSPWWRGLPSMIDNIKNVKDWINVSEKGTTGSTIKSCPGILDLLKISYVVKLPCDFILEIDKLDGPGDPDWRWRAPDALLNVEGHSRNQYSSSEEQIFKNETNIKFKFPVHLTSKKKLTFMVNSPDYHNEVPFKVMPGVMKINANIALPLNINVMFPIPRQEAVSYFFKAGTPIAYLISLNGYRPELHPTKIPEVDGRKMRYKFQNHYREQIK